MKIKILSVFVVLSLLVGLGATATPVRAVGYGTSFLTSITYMNVGTASADIIMSFYSEEATTVTASYPVASLAPGAAASLGVGSVFTTAFKGSGVISSSQPVVATMVQVPQGATTVKNRPLSNGFSNGSTTTYVATALKAKFNATSIISVQNAGASTATVSVAFKHTTDGTDHTYSVTLAPGAAKYYDLGLLSEIGSVFNGSVVITSDVPLVATALELFTNSDAVYAFEGVSSGATTVYMASALCKFGASNTTTSYAVQNSGTQPTNVSVSFKGTANGAPVNVTYTLANSVAAGAKASISGCGDATHPIPSNFIGAATLTTGSVDGGTTPAQPILAIAKVAGNGAFVTAALGATEGSDTLALPYVRFSALYYAYTSTRPVQQTNIAIQNIGGTSIAANEIDVQFIGPDGTVLGTYTYPNILAVGAKFSVNPSMAGLPEFGYKADPVTGLPVSYGGGARIVGPDGSELAAIARVATSTSAGDVAEDYNGLPID